MIYAFSIRKHVPLCAACKRVATAVAIPAIMALGGCAGQTFSSDLAAITTGVTKFTSGISSSLAALNADIQAGVAASAPQLYADALSLDADFHVLANTITFPSKVMTDEAAAIASVKALYANYETTGTLNIATLIADATSLYSIINAAQAAQ